MDSDGDEIVLTPKIKTFKQKKVIVTKKNKKTVKINCQRINSAKNLPKLKDFANLIQSLTESWFTLQSHLYKDFDFYFIVKLDTPHRKIEFKMSGEFDEEEFEEIEETLINCLFSLKFMNMKVSID